MTEIANLALTADSTGVVRATGDLDKLADSARKAETTAQRLQRQMTQFGSQMQSVGRGLSVGLTAPLAGFATAGVMAFSKFDDAITKSLAIMGDLTDTMRDDVIATARQLATESTFSAEQTAEAFYFLSAAGLDASQSISALPQVVAFAEAAAFDLARATDLATDAQSALSLTSNDAAQNLENLTRVTDVLVGANTLANASAEQFSEAITNKAGNAMAQLNIEIEAGVAVLAAWADQGVKGAAAGERFNIVTRDLQRAARNNADEFRRFGVAVFDASGNFRDMGDIVADLERALGGMSVEQQGATLEMMGFQDRSVQALRSLLGLSDTIKDYTGELQQMGGVTQEVADKQMQSFASQMAVLRSEINDVFITIGEGLVPVIRELRDETDGIIPVIAAWAEKFRDMDTETQKNIIGFGAFLAVIGPVLIILGKLISAGATVIGWLSRLAPLLATVTGAFVAVGAAIAAVAVAIERKFTPGMEEVSLGAQIVNVLARAWVVLRETMLGVGEVMLGLGVTIIGALRTISAPFDGFFTSIALGFERLINRDFKGAAEAVRGMGDNIAQSFTEAAAQVERGIGFTLDSLHGRIENAVTQTHDLQSNLLKTGKTAGASGKQIEKGGLLAMSGIKKAVDASFELMETFGGVQEVAVETNGTLVEMVDTTHEMEQSLQDQIEALKMQKLELQGGTRAVLEYELAQARAKGMTDEQAAAVQELIDELIDLERELDDARAAQDRMSDGMGFAAFTGIPQFTDAMETMIDAVDEAGKKQDEWSRITQYALNDVSRAIGDFVSGNISSFSDFTDSLKGTFRNMISDMMTSAIDADFFGALQGGAGVGGALGNLLKSGSMWMAVGGMVLDRVFSSLFKRRAPRFDIAGRGAAGPGFLATRPEWLTTDMGVEVGFNFRRMKDEAEQEIKQSILDMDAGLAKFLRGTPFFEQAQEALTKQAFQSRYEDDDSAFLEQRFDLVLDTFGGFVKGLVKAEGDIEEQMQALADVVAISQHMTEVGFAGLDTEQVLAGINAMRQGGEGLLDAFNRITAAFYEYAGAVASMEAELATHGLNDFQRSMVDIQLDLRQTQRGLNDMAQAAGLSGARAEDMARAHELASLRMAAAIGRYEEQARSLVESLFGTELTRLQDEIERERAAGATDEDLAGLIEREGELQRAEEERQRVLQAQELAQMLADLQQATGDSFSDVAQRLGFELSDLSEVLGVDNARLLDMLQDLQVDPMAIADQIDGMTDRLVEQLVWLPGAFADALADRAGAVDPVIQPPGSVGPPGGGAPGIPPIDDQLVQATQSTTSEVAGLRGDIGEALSAQTQVSQDVAAAIANLTSALRRMDSGPRSSRTASEVR